MPPPDLRSRRPEHQPERRVGLADEIGERDRRNEQYRRAEDRPVASAERRDREGVGESHQRADQSGQRHELEELVGREWKAGLRKLGGDDPPDQPDRKADVLGNDRPDQIASGDDLPFDSQNFSSSGFQSEIQVGSSCSSAISFQLSSAVMTRGMRARAGEPRFGDLTRRMVIFDGRHQWRRHELFKLRASLLRCKIYIYFNGLYALPETFAGANSHGKFAIRSFLELRFAQSCAAHKNWAGLLSGLAIPILNLAGVDRFLCLNREISGNKPGDFRLFRFATVNGMSIASYGQSTKTARRIV